VDDEEYEDIVADIRDECEKFGAVRSLHIPRPARDGGEVRGLGKIFVEFHDVGSARIAQQSLAGRKFAGRTVVTSFVSEERYHGRQF
jgi:splicing factor U2AF subunit